jgi:hypothetical protein
VKISVWQALHSQSITILISDHITDGNSNFHCNWEPGKIYKCQSCRITKTCECAFPKLAINCCKGAQDDTKDEDQDARSVILDKPHGRSRCRKMPVRQSCNGNKWVERALYDSQTCMKCTTAILEAHLARTTRTPHARSKPSNFRAVGERRASGLHESLVP